VEHANIIIIISLICISIVVITFGVISAYPSLSRSSSNIISETSLQSSNFFATSTHSTVGSFLRSTVTDSRRLALVGQPSGLLNECFNVDCPPNYTIAEIVASAQDWDPFDAQAQRQFIHRKKTSLQSCLDTISGVTTSGGWCLSKEKMRVVALPNDQSYDLPYVNGKHVEADALIVEQLDLLLKNAKGTYESVIDFGAGVGQYGHALLAKDPRHRYLGFDGAGGSEKVSHHFLSFFDLSVPLSLPRADWVLSLEVGEHVHHSYEGMEIRNIHAHNKKGIILSWAILGQGGYQHVNCHSEKYLVNIFTELGYIYDVEQTKAFREAKNVSAYTPYHLWFRHSLYVFRRKKPLH
jgi:hypothetical protein